MLFIACAVRDVLCSVVFNLDWWKNHFQFLAKMSTKLIPSERDCTAADVAEGE